LKLDSLANWRLSPSQIPLSPGANKDFFSQGVAEGSYISTGRCETCQIVARNRFNKIKLPHTTKDENQNVSQQLGLLKYLL
jgi:hypothetical protein